MTLQEVNERIYSIFLNRKPNRIIVDIRLIEGEFITSFWVLDENLYQEDDWLLRDDLPYP